MTHLVSEYSQAGGSIKAMPHAPVPTTQIEVENAWEDILLPVSQQYGVAQVVTWQVPAVDSYTDFSKSYVRIRGTWTNGATPAASIQASDSCTVAANFPATLFSQVQLSMQNTLVSPNRTGDPYISFFDRILLKRLGAQENASPSIPTITYSTTATTTTNTSVTLTGVGISQTGGDEAYSLDFLDTAFSAGNLPIGSGPIQFQTNGVPFNYGAYLRAGRCVIDSQNIDNPANNQSTCEYLYQPVIGAWQVEQYVPDRVSLTLNLTINDPAFYTISINGTAGAGTWKFNISTLELVLHRLKMNAKVVEQNSLAMIERPWMSPCYSMIYSKQSIQGANIDLTGVYNGPRPKFVLVAFQDAANAGNNYQRNPYYFSEGSSGGVVITDGTAAIINSQKQTFVANLYILVNGQQFPIRRPYDAVNSATRQREYRALKELTKDGFPDKMGALVSYQQFYSNYTVFPFLIDPLEGEMDAWSPVDEVSIEVHGLFSTEGTSGTIAQPQICHVVAYVPSVMYITGNREVSMKSKSGIPLVFN